MADQDPPVGPLHRLDPTEPDEAQDLGQLEPLDPGAVEAPRATPPAAPPAPRARDGLGLAVALALLLSLSSIAAIGGLVAISVRSLAPAPQSAIISPIDSAIGGPTIRVIESASGPDEARQDPRESRRGGGAPLQGVAAPAPAPAVAPPPAPGGGGNPTDDEPTAGKGGGRRSFGIGGAWCDAAPGTACDVVVGGPIVAVEEEDLKGEDGRGGHGKGH